MKKIISIILVIIMAATLCACGKNSNPDSSYDKVEESVDISQYPELDPISENLDVYRQEIFKRLNKVENFISDEEWSVISKEWSNSSDILYRNDTFFQVFDETYKKTYEYYYPVVFRTGESLVLWYTNDSGSVMLDKVYGAWNGSNYVGHLHSSSDEEWLFSSIEQVLTYKQETGTISVWEFNNVVETFTVPANSVYCGVSDFEGFIFRSETDVYAFQTDRDVWGTICIAHNVKYVIDTDYRAASDPWSQPLFIMTDGTVKVYVRWEGDKNAPADDASHLVSPYYEGGNGV